MEKEGSKDTLAQAATRSGWDTLNQNGNAHNREAKPLNKPTTKVLGHHAVSSYRVDESGITSLEEADFSDIYSNEELKQQKKYIEKVERVISSDSDNFSKLLEDIFTQGVAYDRWLGNDGQFSTDAIKSSKYDDYRHRVDAVVTLKLKDEGDIEELGSNELVFGVDVTTSGDKDIIQDKLARSHNDGDKNLPDGFTRLAHYSNRMTHKKLPLVPRYVIGLSRNDVKNIMSVTANGGSKYAVGLRNNTNSVQTELTRFKLLSEIRAQNVNFGTRLFDSDEESQYLDDASAMVDVLDRILNNALSETTARLSKAQIFSGANLGNLSEKARRKYIDDFIKQRGREDLEVIRASRMKQGKSAENYDDTYSQIMETAQSQTA